MAQGSPSRALEIPELLEAILINVDFQTLLVSTQRVCTRWRDVVATSPKIQEKLFFKPVGGADQAGADMPMWNEVLFSKFNILSFDLTTWGHTVGNYVPQANAASWAEMSAWTEFSEAIRDDKPLDDEFHGQSFTRRDGSWRRMLVCQPPLPGIGLLRDAGGVRIGDLYDVVETGASNKAWIRVAWKRYWGLPRAILNTVPLNEALLNEAGIMVEIGGAEEVAALSSADGEQPCLEMQRRYKHTGESYSLPEALYGSRPAIALYGRIKEPG
ncbi:hypothetical protein CDD82_3661 [Ophiocordyceps australis]|uniref:Uncharacterized protein n=1 Tax=Ophiocordyceps australis TaxID=1399860 RepID=A0A2C5ZCF9_9HYPO|nr:hypothetical protein CDD82_3661 [Ophiocordyceps australis]